MKRQVLLTLLLCAASAGVMPTGFAADPDPSLIPGDPPAPEAQPATAAPEPTIAEEAKNAVKAALPSDTPTMAEKSHGIFSNMRGDDPDAYSIVSAASGLSTHKPMFILPATYSSKYDGKQTEVIFAISAKVQLFSTPFYFAYSQKSFWQVYDSAHSRPFRETDYNPELFYRWTPDPKVWHYWGADVGVEHESNGQDVPDSRSWNRVYVAPFHAEGTSLWYIKAWYRIPEDKKKSPEDANGDDNPDIEDHYGYGEVHWQQQIGGRQVIHTMVRMNPETGHGALNINYTIPSRDGSLFYQVYLWQGYGESLLDYDRSITRIGVGVAFSR
jgi:phospholipase A1